MASRRPLPETLSMVAISFSSSTMSSRLVTSKVPKRGVATARRTHKALRPVPSPSAAAAMKYANSHANQIVFNPPPSAPSPYHTPPLFLPAEDPRRALLVLSHARSNPYASTTPKPLPPPISQPRAKTYHLTPEDIEEMRRLRSSDEWTWTKKKLAEKFGCSELFVAMCVQASETRKEWAKANLERVKERWGPRRRGAREERAKRRELWAKDM
ncbi:MAG: hypothetical protein MMC23_005308 [Stictis urceolatum]|nr:hypothetical protein [Stictis urceolata]